MVRGNARFTANSSYTAMAAIGNKLYVSPTSGAFTETAPSTTGQVVRIIGYVTSAANDKMYFAPSGSWVVI